MVMINLKLKKCYSIFCLALLIVFVVSCSTTKVEIEEADVYETINYAWWQEFKDDNLIYLINLALDNNKDIKVAKLKLTEYASFVDASFGGELPVISTTLGGYNTNRNTKFDIGNPMIPPITIADKRGVVFPISISYEIDYLGKNRDKTKSIKAQFEAYEYQVQSMYLTLISNVSTLYFNIMKINKLIELQEVIISIKDDIINNLNQKYEKGLISNIEINNYKQEILNIKTNIENLNITKNNLLTQLLVLIGKDASNIESINITDLDEMIDMEVQKEVSSDVIFSRPDILAYEKQLQKAEIDVAVARKEFFPTIQLSAGVLFSDLGAGGLFDAKNTIYNILGGLTFDIFTGGRKKANLNIMNSRYEQMFENYKQISLQATKEIQDSLDAIKYNKNIMLNNNEKYDFERQNYNKYTEMYKNDLITEVDLKQLEQKLVAIEVEQVNAKIQEYIDYISLYKATAGKINIVNNNINNEINNNINK